jgi:dihydropteroate synthase
MKNRKFNTRILTLNSAHDLAEELRILGIENTPSEIVQLSCRYVRMENVGLATAIRIRELIGSLGGKAVWKTGAGEVPRKDLTSLLIVGSEAILRSLSDRLSDAPGDLRCLGEELATCLKPGPGDDRGRVELRDGRLIDFCSRTYIMGILNITPDSFSDGGRFFNREKAIVHALGMMEEGADIVDVGGESTRPGAEPVAMEEELQRVIPVIERIAGNRDVLISVDTTKAKVAREALEAGAELVNDVSALRFDPEMVSVVAGTGAPVVLMHMRGTPRTMQTDLAYCDLMGEIVEFLRQRISFAGTCGVKRGKIIVDPGIGFGKSMSEHNFAILRNLKELASLGRPVMVGASRKAFLGHLLHLPPGEREEGTAAAVTAAVMNGAHIVRVHDVKKMKRVVQVAHAIREAGISCSR